MTLYSMLRQQMGFCLDLLLPPTCHLCGSRLASATTAHRLCSQCHTSIPLLGACCRHCAKPLTTLQPSQHSCESCLRRPPLFTSVVAVGLHEEPLKSAIHQLKYRNRPGLAITLGQLLANRLLSTADSAPPDLLVPVPLHASRLRQRGYNQSVELARVIGRQMQLPLAVRSLKRIQPTLPQQGLRLAERQRNLKNAFRCNERLTGQSILLIDDVMTTGATVSECSHALLFAGAREVRVAVVCRA